MTDVKFILPDPTFESHTWLYENGHEPVSQTPLLRGSGFRPQPMEDGLPSRLVINGYSYYRSDPAGKIQSRGPWSPSNPAPAPSAAAGSSEET